MDLIKERFSNHRRIVYSHMSALLNLKCTNLKVFINTVDQQIRSLRAIDVPVDQCTSILIPLFLSKLDQKLAREWETYVTTN